MKTALLVLILSIIITAQPTVNTFTTQSSLSSLSSQVITENGGILSEPTDWSHLSSLPTRSRAAFPSAFDSRDSGWVSPVRDQGNCGGCWTFATFGIVETQFIKRDLIAPNFSEYHLMQNHLWDVGECGGGNISMITAYLSRGDGPLLEEQYTPYPYGPVQPQGTNVANQYIESTLRIPARTNRNDNDPLKQAVMLFGTVYTSYHDDEISYNAFNNSYYYTGSNWANHAVVIVGWDDSKVTDSPTPGAWLIRNSWGSVFGDDGYFWISYDDTQLGYEVNGVFTDPVVAAKYSTIFYYDTLGQNASFGPIVGVDSSYGAVVFTTEQEEHIAAVGTYLLQSNSSYTITIYDSIFTSGDITTFHNPLSITTGTKSYAGYYTIPLSDTVIFEKGETFAIEVKYKTPDYYEPLPIEVPIENYTSNVFADMGESFYSDKGDYYYDLAYGGSNASLCIKALGLNQFNLPPTLTSPTIDTVYEDSTLTYIATTSDPEGSPVWVTFENIPSWFTTSGDTVTGVATSTTIDTSLLVIISDGIQVDSTIVSIIVIADSAVSVDTTRSNTVDTISVFIDTLLDTIVVPKVDTLIRFENWEHSIDSLIIKTDSLERGISYSTKIDTIIDIDTTLIDTTSDTLYYHADTTTEISTSTATGFDTTTTIDSIELENQDTLVTTIATILYSDSTFTKTDNLADLVLFNSAIDTQIVVDTTSIDTTFDTLFLIEQKVSLFTVSSYNFPTDIVITPQIVRVGEEQRIWFIGNGDNLYDFYFNVSIFDNLGNLMFKTDDIPADKKGSWDLRNSIGLPVASGSFLAIVRLYDMNGNVSIKKEIIGVQR